MKEKAMDIEKIATWPSRLRASRELGLSPERITQLVASGRLDAIKTELGMLINPQSLAALRREREAKGAAAE
jgi:hypothetical protein